MKDRTWAIVGPLTGIVFVVLLFLSVGIRGDLRADLEIDSTSAAETANVLVDRLDKVRNGGC